MSPAASWVLVAALVLGIGFVTWCWCSLIEDELETARRLFPAPDNEETRPAVEVAMAADPDGQRAGGSPGPSTYPTGAGSSPIGRETR